MRHGSRINPPNRFASYGHVEDLEHVEWDQEYLHDRLERTVQYLPDSSRSIVAENDSPDIPFRYSVNPYRGCVHGCAYCYARPTHEYLGLNAGLDFETRIMVKHNAARLFRQFLARDGWVPELVNFSGVTDCYQPAEREFKLTRSCVEVALECRQPIGIITKNALVTRDLDLLKPMAERRLARVFVSITTLDPELARAMEPRTSIPAARLRAIRMLADAGVPVGVMVAPLIPGLNDHETAAILEAARDAGAQSAGTVLLRLPLTVEPVFLEWLDRTQPLKAEKVRSRIRQTRGGELYRSGYGERMKGTGPIAEQIGTLFRVLRQKFGLDGEMPPYDCSQFIPPRDKRGQQRLF